MGCGSSAQTQVVAGENQTSIKPKSSAKSRSKVAPSSAVLRVSSKTSLQNNDSAVNSRNSSATSSASKHSNDSGVGDGKGLELHEVKGKNNYHCCLAF